MILLQIYFIIVAFSMLLFIYFRYLCLNNIGMQDKVLIMFDHDTKSKIHIENPMLFVFVPLFNIILDVLIIWIITTNKENVKRFFAKY